MVASNDTDYYTDVMRQSVASVKNKHGFQLDISQMSDDEGPYLVMLIKQDEYTKFGEDEAVAREVAQYLVDVNRALRHAGARVTYLVLESDEPTTIEVAQHEEV